MESFMISGPDGNSILIELSPLAVARLKKYSPALRERAIAAILATNARIRSMIVYMTLETSLIETQKEGFFFLYVEAFCDRLVVEDIEVQYGPAGDSLRAFILRRGGEIYAHKMHGDGDRPSASLTVKYDNAHPEFGFTSGSNVGASANRGGILTDTRIMTADQAATFGAVAPPTIGGHNIGGGSSCYTVVQLPGAGRALLWGMSMAAVATGGSVPCGTTTIVVADGSERLIRAVNAKDAFFDNLFIDSPGAITVAAGTNEDSTNQQNKTSNDLASLGGGLDAMLIPDGGSNPFAFFKTHAFRATTIFGSAVVSHCATAFANTPNL